MDKSKKIMIACIAALALVCAVSLGMLIGTRMNRSKPAAADAEPTETVTQEQPVLVPTETMPVVTEPVVEPDDFADPEPTTQAPTTKAPTTKAPTTKAPTTKAPTTKAPTTKAPTTKAPTTQAPTTTTTTKAPETTTANRNGPYAVIVHGDSGAYDVSGGGRYAPGEFVKVSMTPRVGYSFVRWESSDTKAIPNSTSQTYVFQMPASGFSLHAVTKAQTLLTVNKGKGIAYVSSSRYYTPGEKVTITAQPETGYEFSGWTSSSSTGTASAGLISNSPTFSFTMPDRPMTMTANATQKSYTLRLSAGTGVRSVAGDGKYKYGEKVTLTVSMYDGYTLNRFDGLNATYSGNTVTFNMPAKDLALTATGKSNEKYLVAIVLDAGTRDVQGTGKYAPGETVTVRCTLEKGYEFLAWESSDVRIVPNSTKSVYSFVMPRANVNLTVRTQKTEPEKFLLTLTMGEGVRSVSGSGLYAAGEKVTVSAVVDNGYKFDSWASSSSGMGVPSAGYTSNSQTYTFTMPSRPLTMTAYASKAEQEVFVKPED